jgi:pilus assembly protein CpaB
MKKRLLSVLAFALAVSAGAAFVLYQLIASRVKVTASNVPPTKKIFVAARDLGLGALVAERDVTSQEVIVAPSGAIEKKEDIIGRGVTSPIHQDSPFFDGMLAAKGGGAGLVALIPNGMRAFAVHVNEVAGVAGFAVAGMHVDVLVSGSGQANIGGGGPITRTVLQNIQILSAGQNFQKDAEGKPVLVQVVNLLVTPEQAELLNLAGEQRVQLSLRNPGDNDIVSTPGAALSTLFDGKPIRPLSSQTQADSPPVRVKRAPRVEPAIAAPAPAPAPVAPPHVIQVFAGDKKTESVFPASDKEREAARPVPAPHE